MDRKPSRTSILKPRKSINLSMENDSNPDTDTTIFKDARRVSFASSNFVKPFTLDTEQKTIWDDTYEEEVNHTDSTKSSENIDTKVSGMLNVTSLQMLEFEDKDEPTFGILKNNSVAIVTRKIGEYDKENYFPICRQVTLASSTDMEVGLKLVNNKGTSVTHTKTCEEMQLTCMTPNLTILNANESMQCTYVHPSRDIISGKVLENENTSLGTLAQEMEFTCRDSPMQNIEECNYLNETDKMELTCSGSPVNQILPSKNENALNDNQDMEFTCGYSPTNILSAPPVLEQKEELEEMNMSLTCVIPNSDILNKTEKMELTCSGYPTNSILSAQPVHVQKQDFSTKLPSNTSQNEKIENLIIDESNIIFEDSPHTKLKSEFAPPVLEHREQLKMEMQFTSAFPNSNLNATGNMEFTCSDYPTNYISSAQPGYVQKRNFGINSQSVVFQNMELDNLNIGKSKDIFKDSSHINMDRENISQQFVSNNTQIEEITSVIDFIRKRRTEASNSLMETLKLQQCSGKTDEKEAVTYGSSSREFGDSFCTATVVKEHCKESSRLVEPEAKHNNCEIDQRTESQLRNVRPPLQEVEQKNCTRQIVELSGIIEKCTFQEIPTKPFRESVNTEMINHKSSANLKREATNFNGTSESPAAKKSSNQEKKTINFGEIPHKNTNHENKTIVFCAESVIEDTIHHESFDIKSAEKSRKMINFNEKSVTGQDSQVKKSLVLDNMEPIKNRNSSKTFLIGEQNSNEISGNDDEQSEYKNCHFQPDTPTNNNNFMKIPELGITPTTSFAMVVSDSRRVKDNGKSFCDTNSESLTNQSVVEAAEDIETSSKIRLVSSPIEGLEGNDCLTDNQENGNESLEIFTKKPNYSIFDTSPVLYASDKEESLIDSTESKYHNYALRIDKLMENAKDFLNSPREEFYTGTISDTLLMRLKETNDRIQYLFENFKLPSIEIIDLEEMEILKNESSNSRLSDGILFNNSGSNFGEDSEVDVPKSLDERIREVEIRSDKYWQFVKSQENCYYFYTFYEAVPFKVHLDADSGVVHDVEVFTNLDEDALPLVFYEAKFLHEKMKKDHLLHVLGDKFDIFTLLDYISLCMEEVINFFNEFIMLGKDYGKSHRFRMNPDHSITFEVLNADLIIWWIITGNMSVQNLGNLSSVEAHHKMREPVDDAQIKKIMESTQGPNFLRNFISNVDEYVKKEGRSILARREAKYLNIDKIKMRE